MAKLDGWKTIIGLVLYVAYTAATSRGYLISDPAVLAAIMAWTGYGVACKIDKAAA